MIIDCISDLHGNYPNLKGGDLLIVAGDITARDTPEQWAQFFFWTAHQNYKMIIFIAGNHDNKMKYYCKEFYSPDIKVEYLCDSGTEFQGFKLWGTPRTKTFKGMNPKCKAFTCDTEDELAEHFKKIPHDIDILISHSPPYGILDGIPNGSGGLRHVGSTALLAEICDNPKRNRPALWVFGHIHEMGGKQTLLKHNGPNTICVNASLVDEGYFRMNEPIRIIL